MYKVLKTESKYLVYFLCYVELNSIKSGTFLLCPCILCVKLNGVAQSVERATPGEEVLGSIRNVAALTGWVAVSMM